MKSIKYQIESGRKQVERKVKKVLLSLVGETGSEVLMPNKETSIPTLSHICSIFTKHEHSLGW